MKNPLITIGIACYRSGDTAPRAIESALAQDWPHKEILVVDDGSGDGTADIIRETIAGHGNARLIIHEVNKGFAGALNTIISEARGDFLAIFDDDDVSVPGRVRAPYERITQYEREHNTDMVICHAARIQKFSNGYERYEPTMGTRGGIAPHGEDVVDRILTGRLSKNVVGSCANCSRMARTAIFRTMEGYDGAMRRAEDTDFNIRFGLSGGHFVGIAEPLVIQTMTMGSEKTLAAEQAAEEALLEKHKEYLEKKGWYGFCRSWLAARYVFLNGRRIRMIKILGYVAVRHPVKMLRKLAWIIPAAATRRDFRKWHRGDFSGAKNG
jgi:glycosyltransferase involved in cell wall biosynthesis